MEDSDELQSRLRRHVEKIGSEIGERNVWRPRELNAAADYIAANLTTNGYKVNTQFFRVAGVDVRNIVADADEEIAGRELVVIGAHYDTVPGCPGANDNGSGIAALLEVARCCAEVTRGAERRLRLVAFVNEEPPFFQTEHMGSLVFARAARERGERIVAMVSLETIGYYSDEPESQQYPVSPRVIAPFVLSGRAEKLRRGRLSREGDFIAFVANTASRALLRKCMRAYMSAASVPVEGAAAPGWIPGVGWSDHWAFWQCGYPALMVTDTAPFRYPDYHLATDTPDKLDYERFAEVVRGLIATVAALLVSETS